MEIRKIYIYIKKRKKRDEKRKSNNKISKVELIYLETKMPMLCASVKNVFIQKGDFQSSNKNSTCIKEPS